MRHSLCVACLLPTLAVAQGNIIQQIESATQPQLQRLLKRFPQADADKDGTLSREEALAYAKARVGGGDNNGRTQKGIVPTVKDIAYGDHERHRLDVWKPTNFSEPQPLVIFIHGGGFENGDKKSWRSHPGLQKVVAAGHAAAAINYPFRKHKPIQDILHDAARAVQFLRANAKEYGIDKTKLVGWGGSAGAGTSLWLTTRDDLADADSTDPVLRESSRLQAAVLYGTQATYDLTRWEDFLGPSDPAWWKSPDEAAKFYHLRTRSDLELPSSQSILRECDMLKWISAEDGPVWIANTFSEQPPRNRGQYLHHFQHATTIDDAYSDVGSHCVVLKPGIPAADSDPLAFIADALGISR